MLSLFPEEVHKLEKSYYLPEGWSGVPTATLTEFAAEGTLAGAGLVRLQQQMYTGSPMVGGTNASAFEEVEINTGSCVERPAGVDQHGGKLGFGGAAHAEGIAADVPLPRIVDGATENAALGGITL